MMLPCSFPRENLLCPLAFSVFLFFRWDRWYVWMACFHWRLCHSLKKGESRALCNSTHLPLFYLVATEPVQGKHHTSKSGSHMREKAVVLETCRSRATVKRNQECIRQGTEMTEKWTLFNQSQWLRGSLQLHGLTPNVQARDSPKDTVGMEEWAGNSFCFCSDLMMWSFLTDKVNSKWHLICI